MLLVKPFSGITNFTKTLMTDNTLLNNTSVNSTSHRKQRVTISNELLNRIRRHVSKFSAAKTIADDCELTVQTVYGLTAKISNGLTNEEIIKKKGRNKIDHTEQKSIIAGVLLRDSSFTQKELAEECAQGGTVASQSSMSRILKDMEYTRKRLVKVPLERNSPANLIKRQGYAREITNISDSQLVFLDETGVNLHVSRNYGYSPKNVKATKIVRASRGTNISCMVAINNGGIICWETRDGAFNGEAFLEFIDQKLGPHFAARPNDILVMDNCSFHHRLDVKQLLQEKNIITKYLPPYSPQLNPIEEYFSHFKARLAPIIQISTTRQALKSSIATILQTETIDFDGWYRNMRRYIEIAMSRQEFI